jgi:IS4 transposase
LSTDVNLEAAKVLEIYALRWAVEVYFKEAKQHLGFFERAKYPPLKTCQRCAA